MSNLFCDLHTHSTASDGSDTPADLMKVAAASGLKAVALTDHDTVSGLVQARDAASALGLEFVPGIEFGVKTDRGNMHILGYYMDTEEQGFRKTLERVQKARADRTPKLLARLEELGLPVSQEELDAITGGGQVGRPHFARLMVEKGYVKDVSQAFTRYLARGAKAYVPKSVLYPSDAIDAIHSAGGLAVLAHPFSLMCDTYRELSERVKKLCHMGIDGMECWYSEHSEEFTRRCLDLCREFDIVATGGSDYHGTAKPYIKLGRGKGGLKVPYECVIALKERRKRIYG